MILFREMCVAIGRGEGKEKYGGHKCFPHRPPPILFLFCCAFFSRCSQGRGEVSLSRYSFQGTHYILFECEHTLRAKQKRFCSFAARSFGVVSFRERRCPFFGLAPLSPWHLRHRDLRSIIVLPNFWDVYEIRLHKYVTKSLSVSLESSGRAGNQYFSEFITGNALWYFMSS